MGKNRKNKPRLVCKDGRYYEDGKLLRKKDYIYHSSAHEPDYLLTSNGKYRLREVLYV